METASLGTMDVVKVADYVVDLGPTGGEAGGYIICEGTPEEVAASDTSTAQYIKEELDRKVTAESVADIAINLDDLVSSEPETNDEMIVDDEEEDGDAVEESELTD